FHTHHRGRPRRQAGQSCASATQPGARDLARSRRWASPHRAHSARPCSSFLSRRSHTLFIRDRSIWSLTLTPKATQATQLVFDHGRASSLTLSPDGNLLAFISTRGTGQ